MKARKLPALARMFHGVRHHPPMTTAKMDPRLMLKYLGNRATRSFPALRESEIETKRRDIGVRQNWMMSTTGRRGTGGVPDGVGADVDSDGRDHEGESDEESSGTSFGVVRELIDQVGRIPEEFSVDRLSSAGVRKKGKGSG